MLGNVSSVQTKSLNSSHKYSQALQIFQAKSRFQAKPSQVILLKIALAMLNHSAQWLKSSPMSFISAKKP